MRVAQRCAMFAGGLVVAGAAWAATPWISVPSTATVDQRMVISGGGFEPGAVVTLRIQHPGGAASSHATNADASGKLKFEYTLSNPGGYTVEAFDANGKSIGKGQLGFIR